MGVSWNRSVGTKELPLKTTMPTQNHEGVADRSKGLKEHPHKPTWTVER